MKAYVKAYTIVQIRKDVTNYQGSLNCKGWNDQKLHRTNSSTVNEEIQTSTLYLLIAQETNVITNNHPLAITLYIFELPSHQVALISPSLLTSKCVAFLTALWTVINFAIYDLNSSDLVCNWLIEV